MNLWGVTAAGLAEKLRRDNNDQFNVLVKMHLSFVLDFNTEDGPPGDKSKLKKWSFYKKNKHCGKGVVEGAPLTQEGICQVYQLIEFLKREQNITTEGIFRRTGSLSRQQDLKNLLMQGTSLNFEGSNFNVHDCASVLKGFLAELPEPLLTDAHFPICCQLAELFSSSSERALPEVRLLTALQLLILLLPAENRAFLKDVLELLNLTTLHESLNKMCSDSLATLFTPHLLCPRNLSPENLHVNSQNLSGIVSFMIRKWKELFEIPAKLGVDIKAYYKQQEIKIMLRSSPITIDHRDNINESACDTAKTVYSFVDHEKTAKENQANPTETALAQLYAHIQCMPESSKKRKLIKQFNKENGHGVPLQLLKCGGGGGAAGVGISSSSDNNHHHSRRSQQSSSTATATTTAGGNSIKKLKTLAKAIKLNGFGNQHQRSYIEEELIVNRAVNSCEMSTVKTRLFCTGYVCENNSSCSDEVSINNEDKKPPNVSGFGNSNCEMSGKRSSKSNLDVSASLCMDFAATSTPAMYNHHHHYKDYRQQQQHQQDEQQCACIISMSEAFTPNDELRQCGECQSSSMSPITRSTRRMSKTMQETMMTPRSRKPVLVVSRTNLASLPKFKKFHNSKNTKSMEELRESESTTCLSMIKYTSGRGGTLLRRSKSTSSLQDNDDITSTIEKDDDDGNHHYTSSLTDTFKQYLKDKHNIYVNSNNCKDLIMMDLSENKTTIPNKITSSFIKNLEDHDDNDASNFDSRAENYEKQLVLRPRLFDENGKPIVYETSF